MNIVIFMAIWCQNLWDELILKNQINILSEKYSDKTPNFQVFTYDLNDKFVVWKNITYTEYFPIWIKNPCNIFRNITNFFKFIKVIKKASLVVFWWWGIIFDNENGNYSNPLPQILFRVKLSRLFKKEIIFYWISIDVKNEKNYIILKEIFKNSSIFVRDENSFKFLNTLWIKSEIILDPVFSDNWEVWIKNYKNNYLKAQIKASEFDINILNKFDFKWKKVWLAFRQWYLKDDKKTDEKDIIWKVIDFIISNWWEVVLLPHSFHKNDISANDYEFLKEFVKKDVYICKNMLETYSYYKEKKINFCLSLRLHSMILCKIYGIDFIAIKYAKKSDLM